MYATPFERARRRWALLALSCAAVLSASGQGSGSFKASFTPDSQNRYWLSWPAQGYCQYRVERSTDLNEWEPVATLYNFAASPTNQTYHALTVNPGAPPPGNPPPSNPLVFFTLRPVGTEWVASWTGFDGLEYAQVMPSAPPPQTPPVAQTKGDNYSYAALLLSSASPGTDPAITPSLPSAEAAAWDEFSALIDTLDDPPPSSGIPATAGSHHFWRVREITDSDGDGLSDASEFTQWHTDAFLFDSDGDGRGDYQEIMAGDNPLDSGDVLAAEFHLDWEEIDVYNLPAFGYESGSLSKPALAKYRKRTVVGSREFAEPFTDVPGKTAYRHRSSGTIVEEILNGGAPFRAADSSLTPSLKWTLDFTVGSPVPTSDVTLRQAGFGVNDGTYFETMKKRLAGSNLYKGEWFHATPTTTTVALGDDAFELTGELRSWENANTYYNFSGVTWDFNTQNSVMTKDYTVPGYAYQAKPPLVASVATTWNSLTQATYSQQLTYVNSSGQNAVGGSETTTVTLSDPLTYPGQRTLALALHGGWSPTEHLLNEGGDVDNPGMSYFVQPLHGEVMLQRYRFKFRRTAGNAPSGATYSAPTKVCWIERFEPADLPETPGDESTGPAIERFYSWDAPAGATESPLIELDPRRGPFSGGVLVAGQTPDYGTIQPGTTKVSLLPVDIVVRHGSEPPAPGDGLVVKKGQTITLDINGSRDASFWPEGAGTVTWKKRQLLAQGAFSAWTAVPGSGPELEYTTDTSGIFQVKAVVTLSSGSFTEFQFVRSRDAFYAMNDSGEVQALHKKGAADYFGVVDQDWQIALRDTAVAQLGSLFYSIYVRTVVHGSTALLPGQNKAMTFVFHKTNDNNVPVPITRGDPPIMPPLPVDWWNDNTGRLDAFGNVITSVPIAGWTRLADSSPPQPGWVGVHFKPDGLPPLYDGHLGFIDYDGSWIAAHPKRVSKYYHATSTGFSPYQAFRKYGN